MDSSRIIYIHGSESSGQAYKAQVLRKHFPELIAPDFSGQLALRMSQLESIVKGESGWALIGSSLGGLIAALFAIRHPSQIRKLVLLAPALHLPEFTRLRPKPVHVPTILIIGKKDAVIPHEIVHRRAKRFFPKLTFISFDDDHRLHLAADQLDWKTLLD